MVKLPERKRGNIPDRGVPSSLATGVLETELDVIRRFRNAGDVSVLSFDFVCFGFHVARRAFVKFFLFSYLHIHWHFLFFQN